MAQVFPRSANTLARFSLFCVVAGPLAILLTGSAITRSGFNTKVDVPLDQPVPFSHEHHVNELGIDCRYCHTSVTKSSFAGIPPTYTCMSCHSQIWTNSPLLKPVRDSLATGEPLQWVRVNKLPDFVYFDHSIHINRGINCNVCHGPVHRMQLTYKGKPFFMSFCVNCHRNPEGYLRPREDVFNLYVKYQRGDISAEDRRMLDDPDYVPSPAQVAKGKQLVKEYGIKKAQLTDCWICHR
jgi:hypothetical protein